MFTARIAYSTDFFQSQVPRTKRYLLYCTLISPSRVHFFSDQSRSRERKRLSCRPPRRRAGFGGCGVVGLGAFIHGLPERGEFPLARARAPAEWMVQTPPRRGTGLKEGSGRGHLIHARAPASSDSIKLLGRRGLLLAWKPSSTDCIKLWGKQGLLLAWKHAMFKTFQSFSLRS